jgi:S-layer protein
LVASAAAKSDAAKALKAATDATKATTDDAAATTAVTAASSNTTSAAKAKADADTQVATQKAKISDYDAKTFTLTRGLDNLVGSAGDDTFSGSKDDATNADLNTASNIDTVDGGAGTGDKFKLSSTIAITAITELPIMSNIEILEVTGSKTVTLDTTSVSGLTTLNINKAGGALELTADATTNVAVSNATDSILVKGGKNVTVSDATKDKSITVSTSAATGNAVGAISVTDTNQAGSDIVVDGGTSVTVTATSKAQTGTINVAGYKTASGAVSVTQNLNDDGTGFDNSTKKITVKGGSTITVTSNAASTAKAENANGALAASAIEITSDGKTTDVNVTQNSTVTTFTKAEVPVVKESSVVTFGAMKSGETLIFNGLTFTASKDLTAVQTAAAFANLTAADIQSAGGPVANGTYSGTFNAAVWTSGAANSNVVTFTASDENQTDLAFTGTAATNDSAARIPTQAKTTGTAKVAKVTSTNTITLGAVRIDDAATATIKTVSIDGYKSADIGVAGNDLNALTTLSLANSAGQADVATSATALTLNLNKVKNAVDISTKSSGVVSLKLNATTADSAFVLTAAQVKDLTVDGTKSVDLTGSTLSALETVVVSGTAGLNLTGISASKSVNTTATTGAVTATIDASTASYTGGAGTDNLSLKADVVSKAISLGAGDDTLILKAGSTTVPAVVVDGGDGTDTLSMTTASAVSFGNDTALASKLTSFEKLTISDKAGTADTTTDTVTVGADKLGFTYITTSGTNSGAGSAKDVLVLNNLASGSTVVLTATGSITVAVKDAATGTADSVNVIGSYNGATDAGTFTAANVESVKITTKDTDTTSTGATVDALSLTLVATSAKTLTADGNAPLNLTNTGNTKLETVDASNLAGKFTFVSANTTTAATIKGGAGGDDITASSTGGQADQLYGNGGNDSLTAGNGLTQMWGGTGNDTFKISVASANVNSASAIMDLSTGDVIQITGASVFKQAKISLDPAGNPNLVSYADAAIASIGEGEMAWFQYNGNTYIVSENKTASGHADGSTFINGEDYIVKIVGTAIDLSTASYNSTSNTLEIS